MKNKHPSREECLLLLQDYKTPAHVVKHCKKVAETAVIMARALNAKGYHFDIPLIEATCLIHDIARVEAEHWNVGAEIANQHGYHQEAEIIKVHMSHNTDLSEELQETDIICLADRMVKEDEYVGMEKRMEYVLDRFKDNEEATAFLLEKIEENRKLINRIEEIIGTDIDSLMTR